MVLKAMTDNIQNWQAIRYCDPSIKSTASWSLLIDHLGDSVRVVDLIAREAGHE